MKKSAPPLFLSSLLAEALDEVVRRVRPTRVLELGMHCGYSSVRLLRLLPPAGRLVTVELDPLTAELGEEIILVAGFKHIQVHPGNIIFLLYIQKQQTKWKIYRSHCALLVVRSSRCWLLAQPRPSQHCILFLSLIKGAVRGSVWCWWTMTPSSTFQTCWPWRERSCSAPLAAPSFWSTGPKELKASEESWITSERGPTATASSQSFSLWPRSSTKRRARGQICRWWQKRCGCAFSLCGLYQPLR